MTWPWNQVVVWVVLGIGVLELMEHLLHVVHWLGVGWACA